MVTDAQALHSCWNHSSQMPILKENYFAPMKDGPSGAYESRCNLDLELALIPDDQ